VAALRSTALANENNQPGENTVTEIIAHEPEETDSLTPVIVDNQTNFETR
jgi:hypothetical protein